jgi:hypothetical protein
MEESKNIVVKVEVQVPAGLATGMRAPLPHTGFAPGSTSISLPNGQASVRQVTANSGYICARGTSLSTTSARWVYGKIVTAGTTQQQLQQQYPLPPADARWTTVNRSNGSWCFTGGDALEIPNALCSSCGSGSGSGSGTANTLGLWIDWGSDPLEVQVVNFFGCCSTHTDCTSMFASVPQPALMTAAAPGAVPQQWRVSVEGFSSTGQGALLNKEWILVLREQGNGLRVWDNGGDGKKVPYVELRSCPAGGDWRLTLELGNAAVGYGKPAGEWRPLSRNTLTLAEKKGQRKVPESLTVEPV